MQQHGGVGKRQDRIHEDEVTQDLSSAPSVVRSRFGLSLSRLSFTACLEYVETVVIDAVLLGSATAFLSKAWVRGRVLQNGANHMRCKLKTPGKTPT